MREANVPNVKLGDKVVYKNERYRQFIKDTKGALYGIIKREQDSTRIAIVSWVNHKGLQVNWDYCNLGVGSSEMYFYEE